MFLPRPSVWYIKFQLFGMFFWWGVGEAPISESDWRIQVSSSRKLTNVPQKRDRFKRNFPLSTIDLQGIFVSFGESHKFDQLHTYVYNYICVNKYCHMFFSNVVGSVVADIFSATWFHESLPVCLV